MANRTSRAEKDADQLELESIRLGRAGFDEGIYDERLAGVFVDDSESGPEERLWEQRQENQENLITYQLDEIDRRRKSLGDEYPFHLESNELRYVGSATLVYEFCLSVCQAPTLSKGNMTSLPREFERMAGRLAASYLGRDAEWYRLGWPPENDRPQLMQAAIAQLYERTGEFHWNPDPAIAKLEGPLSVKDGGIDLVVWKRFGDRRVGSLFLLGQCACGDNWVEKLGDLEPESFRQAYLKTLSYTGQIKFLALPWHVSDDVRWNLSSSRAGILLDRVRLTMLAEADGGVAFGNELSAHRAKMAERIGLVVKGFDPERSAHSD